MLPLLVGAAISAAAAAKASHDARNARLGAQNQAQVQDSINYERQKEFAQNAIQWRVADARKAGLHPLYALQGGGASYSPGAVQAFGYDPGPTLSLGRSLSSIGSGIADYFERGAQADAGFVGPPAWAAGDGAQAYSVADYGQDMGIPLAPLDFGVPPPYGMVSHTARPSSQFWDVPKFGKLVLPAASDFSQSLEGLDSMFGQVMYTYINAAELGPRAAEGFARMMGEAFGGSKAAEHARMLLKAAHRIMSGELVSNVVKELSK